jgi:hypothetical protein
MSSQSRVAHVFKAGFVERDAPAASGVYGLSNSQKWIYIGATDNIKAQLMMHLQETTRLPQGLVITGFFFEKCTPEDRVARQDRLVRELRPVFLPGNIPQPSLQV